MNEYRKIHYDIEKYNFWITEQELHTITVEILKELEELAKDKVYPFQDYLEQVKYQLEHWWDYSAKEELIQKVKAKFKEDLATELRFEKDYQIDVCKLVKELVLRRLNMERPGCHILGEEHLNLESSRFIGSRYSRYLESLTQNFDKVVKAKPKKKAKLNETIKEPQEIFADTLAKFEEELQDDYHNTITKEYFFGRIFRN